MTQRRTGSGKQRPKHAPGAPRMPFAVLVLLLIGGSMCALLALNTASAANEVRRHDLAVRDAAISDSLVQVNNDVNDSAAPQNLAAAAAALGMVPAGNPAFLVIGTDGKAHVMGSPAPATGAAIYQAPRRSTAPPASSPTGSATASGKVTGIGTGTAGSTATSSASTSPGSTHSSAPSTSHGPSHSPTTTPTPTPNTTLPGGPR